MKDMIIRVKLRDTLKSRARANLPDPGPGEMTLPAGATVNDLVLKLGLEKELIGLIVVNKRQRGYEDKLQDGDLVELFSPMAGG